MTPASLPPTLTSIDAASGPSGLATCPLCRTTRASLTLEAVAAGADWRCDRCGQRWDACRLATRAAYSGRFLAAPAAA